MKNDLGIRIGVGFACALCVLVLCLPAAGAVDAPKAAPIRQRAKADGAVDIDRELARIIDAAGKGRPDALSRFLDLMRRITVDPDLRLGKRKLALPEKAEDMATLQALFIAYGPVDQAFSHARSALGNPDYDEGRYDELLDELAAPHSGGEKLAEQAARLVEAARREGAELLRLRKETLERYTGESRKGVGNPGTRAAWSLLRLGAGRRDALLDPGSLASGMLGAEIELVVDGVRARVRLNAVDQGLRVRAVVDSYDFTANWAILVQKPFAWMLEQAKAMRAAEIPPEAYPRWIVMEAPEGLVSLAYDDADAFAVSPYAAVPVRAFYRGRLHEVRALPVPGDAATLNAAFVQAARRLHEGIMADERVPRAIRQALRPVLEGTYLAIDPRDYFDGDFCRRLVEADYLETYINPMPPERAAELAEYREALARMEAGYDRFAIDLDDGLLVAVAHADAASGEEGKMRMDPDTGEAVPPFEWRLEEGGRTAFHSPLPARQLNALSLVERYDGIHRVRPRGVAEVVEVWHPVVGRIASYRDGESTARGREEDWLAAATLDGYGRIDTTQGPLGWSFPFHVLQRDDQGDPVLLATTRGIVKSPDFRNGSDPERLRRDEDAWLDHAASVLREPGELGLIFHHFFRYCSDSPLPELPNLIGSHYGLSDTHQTVYQSLERRWVGRLIGDCDDLAEFFQTLTERQGKLSHVMQVPAHAAAGYAERLEDGTYRFVVLQTGPVLQFTGDTLFGAVEAAYSSFDSERGTSQITAAAVPILLRFGGEDTRTPFVLPVRIYEDREYAEAMIRVQGYWHLHAFSSAIAVMEEMIETDRQVGNIKELASLYEQVGAYARAAELRREELAASQSDKVVFVSSLFEMVNLHIKNKDWPAVREALAEMESALRVIRDTDAGAHARVLPFRHYWAMLQARYSDPARAWDMLRSDAAEELERTLRLPEYMTTPLVMVYERLALRMEGDGGAAAPQVLLETRMEMEEMLDLVFGEGYFRADDSYNRVMARYNLLGRYAVAVEGWREGLRLLDWDGPYPEGPRDHAARWRAVSGRDWEWFRIIPDLYLGLGMEMLDADDSPELYNPAEARKMLLGVARAVEKGRGLGSDVVGAESVVKSRLILSFLDNDPTEFERVLAEVREKNYSSLYDDAAQAFGKHCGLVPVEEFPAWVEVFHRFFPDRQHYFKVVYRALDNEFFDHALLLARATTTFFPDDELLAAEAAYVEKVTPELRKNLSGGKAVGAEF